MIDVARIDFCKKTIIMGKHSVLKILKIFWKKEEVIL